MDSEKIAQLVIAGDFDLAKILMKQLGIKKNAVKRQLIKKMLNISSNLKFPSSLYREDSISNGFQFLSNKSNFSKKLNEVKYKNLINGII